MGPILGEKTGLPATFSREPACSLEYARAFSLSSKVRERGRRPVPGAGGAPRSRSLLLPGARGSARLVASGRDGVPPSGVTFPALFPRMRVSGVGRIGAPPPPAASSSRPAGPRYALAARLRPTIAMTRKDAPARKSHHSRGRDPGRRHVRMPTSRAGEQGSGTGIGGRAENRPGTGPARRIRPTEPPTAGAPHPRHRPRPSRPRRRAHPAHTRAPSPAAPGTARTRPRPARR